MDLREVKLVEHSGAPPLVFLTGLSGSGKSTVGRELAKLVERQFFDTDESIVKREGKSIKAIFDLCGEERFREIEAEVIKEIVESVTRSECNSAVVALGGGALMRDETVQLVKSAGALVYLNIACDIAAERLRQHSDRPLTLDEAGATLTLAALSRRLEELLNERKEGYSAADYTVSISTHSISETCREICNAVFPSRL